MSKTTVDLPEVSGTDGVPGQRETARVHRFPTAARFRLGWLDTEIRHYPTDECWLDAS